MRNDLEQFDKLMGNAIEQLNEIIVSLNLTQKKQPEPEPQAPTTIDAVYEQVEPQYSTIPTEVPSLINVNQVDAFAQLLTLVDCLNSHFGGGDGKMAYSIDRSGSTHTFTVRYRNLPVIHFKTREAAEHARDYFMPLIKKFYGVDE
jgi:hypothetical protein